MSSPWSLPSATTVNPTTDCLPIDQLNSDGSITTRKTTSSQIVSSAGAASLASPAFTGVPTAPTPVNYDNSTKIATTAFVQTAIGDISGGTVTSVLGNTGAVTLSELVTGGVAPISSPTFSGTPTAPTPIESDNSTKIATTAFVQTAIGDISGGTVTSVLGNTGAVTLSELVTGGVAPISSPIFSGTPTAPTPIESDNSTKIATTAFVQTAIGDISGGTVTSVLGNTGVVTLSELVTGGVAPISSPTFSGTPTAPTPNNADNSTKLATTAFVTNAASLLAPLASPTFTGNPVAPTATFGTNTTQVATTAFVQAATAGTVTSVVGNGGVVTLSELVTGGVAPIASPTFTGNPVAPTATFGTNTTQVATTAFVQTAIGDISGGTVTSVLGNTGAVTLSELVTGGVAPIASPTFTGIVTTPAMVVGSNIATGPMGPVVNGASGNIRNTFYQTAGVNRWAGGANETAENNVVLNLVAQTNSGSNVLTFASTSAISVGMYVQATGIVANTTVTAITSGTAITISNNATSNISNGTAISFGTSLGSDYHITAYDDYGNTLGPYLALSRATNSLTLGQNTTTATSHYINGAALSDRGMYLQTAGNNAAFVGVDNSTINIVTLVTTATANSGTNVLTFASTTGVTSNDFVSSVTAGIPLETTISSFTSTTVTLKQNLTASLPSGTVINFGAANGSRFVIRTFDDYGNNYFGDAVRISRWNNSIELNGQTLGNPVAGAHIYIGTSATSPVQNGIHIVSQGTGLSASINAFGVDANSGLSILGSGTGSLYLGNGSGYKFIDLR